MMEPEPAPTAPEEETGAELAQEEQDAPEAAPQPAPDQPAPLAAEPESVPLPPAPADPPPPPDTPRWAETPPPAPASPAPVEPAFESAPEPPAFEAAQPPTFESPAPPPAEPTFESVPEPPVPEPPTVEPLAFETPVAATPAAPAPAVSEAPVPAVPEPPAPTAPVVDPAFARANQAASVPEGPADQGWGVAQLPSFAPESPSAPAPFGAAAESVPASSVEPAAEPPTAQDPAEAAVDSQAFATQLEAPAEPEPAPAEHLAPVIPIDLDGTWVAGRSGNTLGGDKGSRAPKEKGSRGLRFKRSRGDAGLELVEAPPAAEVVPAAPEPAEPAADAEPKPKRGFSKEIRFGRKKKKDDGSGPGGGLAAVPVPPVASAPGAGFDEVAPAPPVSPPPPAPVGPPRVSGSDAGFGSELNVGTQSGFGPPASAEGGWSEPIPEKKRRGLRLPTSSVHGRPMMAILLAVVLVAAAVGYFFFFRGGASQPAYALDLAAGQKITYKMTMGLNGKLTVAGRVVPLQEELGATMSWNVQSVDAGGVATVDVQIGDAQVTVNGQSISAKDIPAASLHYTMRIAKDGSILSGGGFGALSGGSSGAAGEVPGTDQLTPLLPGHDVSPGDSWDKTFDSELPYGMGHVHYVTHSTYVRNEDVNGVSASVIESKMSLPLHMKVDMQKMLQAIGTEAGLPAGSHPVISYRGHVSGTTTGWFDPNARQLLKTSVEADFNLTMTFHGLPAGTLPGGTQMGFRGAILVNLQKV